MSESAVPEGWTTAKLDRLNDPAAPICYGVLKPGRVVPDGVRMLRVKDLQRGSVQVDEVYRIAAALDREFARSRLRSGDVIISVQGSIGRVAIVPSILAGSNISRTLARVRPAAPELARWLWLSLQAPQLQARMGDVVGGTTRDSLNIRDLRELELPVPPLAEQYRIGASVEALLARVDAVRVRLTKVPAIIKRFRQSVLAAAYSGKLSEGWRETHPHPDTGRDLIDAIKGDVLSARLRRMRANIVDLELEPFELPSTWSWASVADVSVSVTDGDHQPPPKAPQGVPFLVIGNVSAGRLDFEETAFVPQSYYDALSDDRRARPDDVLYTVTGSYGICLRVDTDRPFCFQRHIGLIRPHHQMSSEFLRLALASPLVSQQAAQVATGIAQLTVPLSGLRAFRIPVPPKLEQQEIVSRANELLTLADAIERLVGAATARGVRLAQAILDKAFRGELVPTEAELARAEGRAYEPASALLERLGKERLASGNGPSPSKRRRPARRSA